MHGHALHKLVAGLVRRTWLLAIVATLTCAAFAATAVASLVEASYLAPASHAAALPARVMNKPVVTKVRPDGSGFVVRNMFCSTCTPLPGGSGPTDSFVPQGILIATSVGAEPRATVRAMASEAQGSYGIGDMIPTVGKLDRIGWRSIDVIDSTGRRGRLDLLDGDPASRGSGAATPDPAAASDPLANRVRKIDDHTFEVDRDLVRDLVSGSVKPNGLRITPINDHGELKGLRLFGVKPGSVAGTLGLQNGDTLTTINNNQIKSAQTLLDVYANIDTLNVVELDGTRAGKPLAITLRLR